jgi:hypothetical protein
MMKLSYLTTHWTPDEAHTILMFVDELRDMIWQTYGSDIREYHQTQCQAEEDNMDTSFDDPLVF